jgi:hypothetical protein
LVCRLRAYWQRGSDDGCHSPFTQMDGSVIKLPHQVRTRRQWRTNKVESGSETDHPELLKELHLPMATATTLVGV